MNRRNLLLRLLGLRGLVSCTPSQIYRGTRTAIRLQKGDVARAVSSNLPLGQLPAAAQIAFRKMLKVVIRQWGDKKLPRPKEVVKYTDHYQSRAHLHYPEARRYVEKVVAAKRHYQHSA